MADETFEEGVTLPAGSSIVCGGTFTIGSSAPIPWDATPEEANAILARSHSNIRIVSSKDGEVRLKHIN